MSVIGHVDRVEPLQDCCTGLVMPCSYRLMAVGLFVQFGLDRIKQVPIENGGCWRACGRQRSPRSKPKACPACMPSPRKACTVGTAVSPFRPRSKASSSHINWWLAGWPAAFVARQGYYHSIPDNAKKYLEPVEWDYWYMGKPAAKDLPDPLGTIIIKKGDIRTGGSYWDRFKIAVWNSVMDENDYLTKRWTEFLNS